MNLKELVSVVSQETGVPAGQVRKVSQSLLKQMANLLDEGGQFRSSYIRLSTTSRPSRTVTGSDGTERHVPERRFGRLTRVSERKKPAESEIAS